MNKRNPLKLVACLREKGYRLTAPRAAVARVLAEATTHLTAEEICGRARKLRANTGLVTVYRTLELLADQGSVSRIHTSDGCHAYAVAAPGHSHHLVCNQCHSVTDFDGCDLSAFLKGVQRKTGYEIRGHWLELTGLCPACRKG